MRKNIYALIFFIIFEIHSCLKHQTVIATWPFVDAVNTAWDTLNNGGTRMDAVERGCTKCEEMQW